MSSRFGLLATVSAGALLSATAPSFADFLQDGSGYWVSTGGAYLTANGTSQQLLRANNGTDVTGLAPISDRVHSEWLGQVAIGGPLGGRLDGWDFKLAYTGIRSENHRRSASTVQTVEGIFPSSETFSSSLKQGFDIGDFEIGQDVGLGGLPSHFFLGMRFVSFNQSSRSTLLGGEGGTELACSHFGGAGPRAGFSSSLPFANVGGIALSLTGSIDASLMEGKGYHKATFSGAPESSGNYTGVAENADVQAGIMMGLPLASHEFDLTLGYMAQGWWNVVDTRVNGFGLAGTGGSTGGNQYLHGPFLNVAMKW
jgi:major outer membrane protein